MGAQIASAIAGFLLLIRIHGLQGLSLQAMGGLFHSNAFFAVFCACLGRTIKTLAKAMTELFSHTSRANARRYFN